MNEETTIVRKRDLFNLVMWAVKHDEITAAKGAELLGIPTPEFKKLLPESEPVDIALPVETK